MRMVFVANHPDASGAFHDMLRYGFCFARVCLQFLQDLLCSTGLVAFELPFAYITGDKFKQPVFGCNNLAGRTYLLSHYKLHSDLRTSQATMQSVLSYLWFEQGSAGRLSLEEDRLGPSLPTTL